MSCHKIILTSLLLSYYCTMHCDPKCGIYKMSLVSHKIQSGWESITIFCSWIYLSPLEGDGGEIQAALAEWTGQRTVPNVFIGGKHIGGCDCKPILLLLLFYNEQRQKKKLMLLLFCFFLICAFICCSCFGETPCRSIGSPSQWCWSDC